MTGIRLIARLDIKGPHLIKSIQMEGVRKLGDPNRFATAYYDQDIDEILYMDAVASLYDRGQLLEIVERTAERIFVPITAGGGIRSVEDARELLRAGADKVAINTAAIRDPNIVSEVAMTLGAQCMVLSIEAKSDSNGRWEAFCDGGREHTGLDVVEWAMEGERLGAGEILLTSVDREGTAKGFDINLIKAVTDATTIPVIASGGMGNIPHLIDGAKNSGAEAFAMANVLHYQKLTLSQICEAALDEDLPVRRIAA